MRLALASLVVSGLFYLGSAPVDEEAAPPQGAAQTLVRGRAAIAWFEAGYYERGSDEDEIDAAVLLCERTLEVAEAEIVCHPETFHDEGPTQRVFLDAFGLDRTEVTVAAYRRCIAAGICTPGAGADDDRRLSRPEHPITSVHAGQAARFCTFVGGRLPTEAEWERAARGRSGRRFPWGQQYNDRLANHGAGLRRADPIDGHRYVAPVGSYPDGATPAGVHDLAGNVWEWTADAFLADAHSRTDPINPRIAAGGGFRVIRGGSWRVAGFTLRGAQRSRFGAGEHAPDIGFRCAYDPPE